MNEELRNPFVVQCKECNNIIADSFNLKDYRNGILIFSALSSIITVDEKRNYSKDPIDYDCIYNTINCKCNTAVGRKYITVTEEQNGYAGMYFIEKEHVYTYMLGCDTSKNEISLTDIVQDIERIQNMCLYLYSKIEKN